MARVTQNLPGTDKGEAARDLVKSMSHMLANCGEGSPSLRRGDILALGPARRLGLLIRWRWR